MDQQKLQLLTQEWLD